MVELEVVMLEGEVVLEKLVIQMDQEKGVMD
jgi:hypothetical protein